MTNKFKMAAMTLGLLAGTAGVAAAQDYRYYDRDDYGYHQRDDFRDGIRSARNFGFHDGSQVAREDMWRGKPFNPNPRGPYESADNGYRREFGSIHQYRDQYAQAYRQAYESAFRRRRYYR
ncbi:MAG TPA: hypothetical protein VJO35_14410 [Terriglobales bacterium]|nr:hypothetical protein [Terriglobales bacterium]